LLQKSSLLWFKKVFPVIMEDDMTVLARIVSDAIHAYPTDANHQILAFVAGVPDKNDIEIMRRDKDTFMESWSKCVLKAKAFGSREPFNPVAFRQDLIMELTHGNKDASKLNDMSKMFLRDSTSRADSKSLHAMSYIGSRLLAALDDSYHYDSHSSNKSKIISHDSAIMFQRQRFRGAKFNWSTKGKTPTKSSSAFCPLSQPFLGSPLLLYGWMELRQAKNVAVGVSPVDILSQSPLTPQTLSVVGIKLESKRGAQLSQSRAWTVYNFLCGASAACGSSCIFPHPVGVNTERPTGIAKLGDDVPLIFAFECAEMRPLSPILGMRLAVLLGQYPHVLLMWCRQLSAAIHHIESTHISIVDALKLTDLFVRDDGLLCLGNIAVVEERDPDDSGPIKGKTDITNFAASILTSTLCLSRRQIVNVSADRLVSHIEDDLEEIENVISVFEGCTLDLVFVDSRQEPLRIVLEGRHEKGRGRGDEGDRGLQEAFNGEVSVSVHDESAVAAVSTHTGGSTLAVKGTRVGNLLLEVTSQPPPSSSSGSSSKYGHHSNLRLLMRIVVLRCTPVRSMEFIELSSLLEISHTRSSSAFRNARCFRDGIRGPGSDVKGGGISDEEMTTLAVDWREVSQMILRDPPCT
jgi:hypothetical protein